MHSPNPSIDEIVEVVKYDQAVTAQILKICNSAYFGLVEPVESLNDAMMAIGTFRLLQLVMAMQSGEVFSVDDKKIYAAYGVNSEEVWYR
jgi:HD-like signal output (HDOD) protein